MSRFSVPLRPGGGGPPAARAESLPGRFSKLWPALSEFIEVTEVEGAAREPGSLLLFGSEGGVKAMLKDVASRQVCFLFGLGVTEALDAAEKVLVSGHGDWRADRPQAGRKKG